MTQFTVDKPGNEEPVALDRAGLKRLLKRARSEPVMVAFALDAQGKALILMDHHKQPRALEKALREGEPESRNHRFGTAWVDAEEPKLVHFNINKTASGMARRLVKALKGTGYSKVEITAGEGDADRAESDEPEEDDDAERDEEGGDRRLPPPTHRDFTASDDPDIATKMSESKRPDEPAKGARKPDPAPLVAELTPLVRRAIKMIADRPDQKSTLAALMKTAQDDLRRAMLSLAGTDIAKAQADITALRDAMDRAGPNQVDPQLDRLTGLVKSAGTGMANPKAVELVKSARAAIVAGDAEAARKSVDALAEHLQSNKQAAANTAADWGKKQVGYGKAAEIWAKTVNKMESNLHLIRKDLLSAFEGDEEGKDMEQELLGEIEACLKTLDLSLHKQLDSLTKIEHGQAADGRLATARKLVEEHVKHLETDHFMQHVDENPSGIAVRETLQKSLTMIGGVLAG